MGNELLHSIIKVGSPAVATSEKNVEQQNRSKIVALISTVYGGSQYSDMLTNIQKRISHFLGRNGKSENESWKCRIVEWLGDL